MRTTPALLAAAATALATAPSAHAAEALFGLTQGNVLVTLQSDNTASIGFERAVQGLPAGEQLIGIDVRPATGQLFALGQSSRLYVLDPRTARARQIGPGPFSPPLAGRGFGFDFNPTVDRIRVVSDAEQNLRLNPDDGTATNDGPLAYAADDPGAGKDPSVETSAYSNSVAGAQTTALFAVDDARGTLVTQNPANAGTLRTVGALGGRGRATSFDIGSSDAAFLLRAGRLDRVDLRTGRASTGGVIDTARPLRAIAAAGSVPDDGRAPRQSVALSSTQLDRRLRTRGVVPTVACDEACRIEVRVTAQGRTAGRATGAVRRRAGREAVPVRLDARTRKALSRGILLTVRIRTTDGAGNGSSQTRRVRVRR